MARPQNAGFAVLVLGQAEAVVALAQDVMLPHRLDLVNGNRLAALAHQDLGTRNLHTITPFRKRVLP